MFDFDDFINNYGSLSGEETEHEFRTAISRIYYGIYNKALNHSQTSQYTNPFKKTNGLSVHIDLQNWYKTWHSETELYNYLAQLHALRKASDYDLKFSSKLGRFLPTIKTPKQGYFEAIKLKNSIIPHI